MTTTQSDRFQLDNDAFRRGHAAFLAKMEEASGVPFSGFGHRFFVQDELSFKLQTLREARCVLEFDEWPNWRGRPGKILAALRKAVQADTNGLLLTHQYGDRNGGYKALYLVADADVPELESHFYRLLDSVDDDDAIGPAFDDLVEFLKDKSLGCTWEFLAYFLYVMRPERFFPIHSGPFQSVIEFYGIDHRIKWRVNWEAYKGLLDIADLVKERLQVYGTPLAIDVQSYMWVVSYLLDQGRVPDHVDAVVIDFEDELQRRRSRNAEQERIGLRGEQIVYDAERKRLRDAGRPDLADRVRLISAEDDSAGYDILSYESNGDEKLIEVKATNRTESEFDQFWLSENEAQAAMQNARWTLCRVWDIDGIPNFRFLGNIVQDELEDWEREPFSWVVRKRVSTELWCNDES